jgi:predicted secreted protein
MNWTSIVAIYLLFWVLSAFLVLPFGVKTHEELGLEKTPGQADSAPGNFRPLMVLLRTTLLSAALFGLYYANYINGWIDCRHPTTTVSPRWHCRRA